MDTHSYTSTQGDFPPARVFAITSGKEGVGKTTTVANLAAALALAGKRVTVVDGDLGLANLDILLGVRPRYTLADFFAGTCPLADILITGPLGITLLPAASGVQQVTRLSQAQKIVFLSELDALTHNAELMLVDTGSGISDTVTYFASAAHEVVVVVTPDPASLTDTHALLKVLASAHQEKRFWLLANRVEDEQEARRLYDLVSRTALRFLNASFDFLGWIPRDRELVRAVSGRQMVVEASPRSPSAQAFSVIARRLVQSASEAPRVKGGLQFFFHRIVTANFPASYATRESAGQTYQGGNR